MANYKLMLLLFLPLSFVVPGQEAEAPEVILALKTGEKWKGEILSVRDRVLAFSTEHGKTEKSLSKKTDLIMLIGTDDIQLVTLKGESYVLTGMQAGIALGGLAGYLVGSSQRGGGGLAGGCEEIGYGSRGCLVGSVAGCAVGGLVGGDASRKDSVISGTAAQDISRLKALARYQGEEPEFLQAIRGK